MTIDRYELRTKINGEMLACSFADEYDAMDFCEALDPDAEIHVVKISRYKPSELAKIGG